MNSQKVVTFILVLVVLTLALVMISVVSVMLLSLFDDQVNNDEIFKLIGPAFNMIVGAFVGLLGGITISKPGKTP